MYPATALSNLAALQPDRWFRNGDYDGLMTNLPARLNIEVVEPRRLALHGDLDAHTANMLEDMLEELGASDSVDLVMADVAFMDSTGIRVVVAAHGNHTDAESTLNLVTPSDAVLRILEITGLTDVLSVRS